MAKTNGVTKSQAILTTTRQTPGEGPGSSGCLAKTGITVTTNLVATVKSKHNQKQAPEKRRKVQ